MLWNIVLEFAFTLLLVVIQSVQQFKNQPAGTLAMVAFVAVSVSRLVLSQAIEFKLMDYQYRNVPKQRIGTYRAWKLVVGLVMFVVIITLVLLKVRPAYVLCCLVLEMNLDRFAKDMMRYV